MLASHFEQSSSEEQRKQLKEHSSIYKSELNIYIFENFLCNCLKNILVEQYYYIRIVINWRCSKLKPGMGNIVEAD